MKASKFLTYGLVFYFLIPYILFFHFFNFNLQLDLHELFWAFKNSFIQSSSAALIITFFSIPLSMGLFEIPERYYDWTLKLLLLPQVLPSFFTILIAFSIWKPFPLGTLGICFVFVIIYLGFAVVFVHAATREKLGSFSVVSEIFNLSRFQFFKNIYFPILKNDLLSCFLMIFTFCFSSFSIPLIAGGGRDTNMEVLVFEKIFINQNWSSAWTISIIQSLFLVFMSVFLIKKQNALKRQFIFSDYLTSFTGYTMIVIYLFVYIAGYAIGLIQAVPDLPKVSIFYGDIVKATLNSIQFLLIYMVITFLLLYLWIYDFIKNHKLNFASHLISASTMVVGFSFYLFFPQSHAWDYFKIPIAMSILVFPVLFKSFLEKAILDLKDQVLVAQIYGVSTFQILLNIILRRIKQPLTIWFLFLSIWFICDFATLRALGVQTNTLSLMAQSFLSSYRLSLAYLLSVYILVVWVVILVAALFLKGVVSVAYKKFKF